MFCKPFDWMYNCMKRKKYQQAANVGGQLTRFALALEQFVVCSSFPSLDYALWVNKLY